MKNYLKTLSLVKIFLRMQNKHLSQVRIFLRKKIKIGYLMLARILRRDKVLINLNQNRINFNKINKKKQNMKNIMMKNKKKN